MSTRVEKKELNRNRRIRLYRRTEYKAVIMAISLISLIVVAGCSGKQAANTKTTDADKSKKNAKKIGYDAYKKGNWDQAIKNLKQAEAKDPKDINIKFQLAQSYENKNMYEEALKQYKAVLTINKNNADAHYSMGRIFMEKNEIDKAIPEFEAAIASNQSFASARVDLANAYTSKKNYVKALAIYDELAKTFKTDTKYLSHIHTLKGNIYKEMNDKEKAKAEYEAAIKLDVSNTEAVAGLNSLGK